MAQFIALSHESDINGESASVELTKNIGDDAHISVVLWELKRFLHAIGYDWVEAVEVQGPEEEDGSIIIHSSEDATEYYASA